MIQPAPGHTARAGIGSDLIQCLSHCLALGYLLGVSRIPTSHVLTISMTFPPKPASTFLPLPGAVHLCCHSSQTSPKLHWGRDVPTFLCGLLMAGQTFSKGSGHRPPFLPVKLILQCPLPSFLLPVALSPLSLCFPGLKLVHSSFREPSAIVTKPTSCLTSQASFNKVEMERKLPPLHSVLSGLVPWRIDVFILFSGTVWWIMALLARRDAKIRGYVPVMLMLLYPTPDSQGPFTGSQYLLDSLIKEIDEDVCSAFPMPGTRLPQAVTEWSLSHHSSLSWNVTCFPEYPLSSSTSVSHYYIAWF